MISKYDVFKVRENNILLFLITLFTGLFSGFLASYLIMNQDQWYLVLAFILSLLIIYKPIFGIISIIILAPFGIFVVVEGVGTISRYLGILTLVSFSIRLLFTDNLKIIIPRELYWFGLFILFGFVSIFWANSASTVIARSFTLIQLTILYIITYNLLSNNPKNYKYIYISILIAGVCISAYSILILVRTQGISYFTRISIAQQIDVNHLASFLLITFWISFFYFKDKSKIYIFPLILISIAIVITQSRAALIAFLLTFVMYSLLNKMPIKSIIVFLILSIIIVWIVPEQFFYRFTSFISDKELILSAGGGRGYIWSFGWELFKSSPLYGTGLGNFTWIFRPPHSLFVQIISELGIIGLILFSIFLYKLFLSPRLVNGLELYITISIFLMSLTVDIFYTHYFLLMLSLYSVKKKTKLSETS
jgi:O-antigen ligase